MSLEGSSISSAVRALRRWTGTRACVAATAGLVFAAVAAHQLGTHDFPETVPFATDQVHHQFLAVNLALGHGYQVGPAEPFERYRIDRPPRSHDYNVRFIRPGVHRHSFGRTPGYPLFLAAIYAVAGVEPRAALVIQALLIALAAAVLPVLGTRFWSRPGLLAGAIAAGVYSAFYAPDPTALMAEPRVVIGLLGIAAGYICWSTRPTALRALVLGLLVALALLVRPNAVFVPLAFLALFAARVRPLGRAGLQGLALAAGIALPILPWSVYATVRSEEPGLHGEGTGAILLSTQASRTLLDGNNEACFGNGRWHPEWRTRRAGDPRFFYNRIADQRRSTASMLAEFWWNNLGRLPGLFADKIAAAFARPRDLGALLAMLACYLALGVIAALDRRARRAGKDPPATASGPGAFLPLIYAANLIAITAFVFGDPRLVQPFIYFALLPTAGVPLVVAERIGAGMMGRST